MTRDETKIKLWTDVYAVTLTEEEHKRGIFSNGNPGRPKVNADRAVREFDEENQ